MPIYHVHLTLRGFRQVTIRLLAIAACMVVVISLVASIHSQRAIAAPGDVGISALSCDSSPEYVRIHSDLIVVVVSIANLALLGGLIFVTWRYMIETRRIADSTVSQANAGRDMVQAMSRPVILQWVDDYIVVPADENETGAPYSRLDLKYKNIGSGPAINLEWNLLADQSGHWMDTPRRLGMSGEDAVGNISAEVVLPIPEELWIETRYEDIFGNRWVSRLCAVKLGEKLVNGESRMEAA